MCRFGRFMCFVILAGIGLATIGVALLAGPASLYQADQLALEARRVHIAKLKKLCDQHNELLDNADNPSVVARAAISNLNYVPVSVAAEGSESALGRWPELDSALAKVDSKPVKATANYLVYAEVLAKNGKTQTILMVLGSVLVVVSLTFFHKNTQNRRPT